MTIDLSDFESGDKYRGHYKRDLAKLQEQLEHIFVAHIVHHRAAVVMLEGWDAARPRGSAAMTRSTRSKGTSSRAAPR